LTEGRSGRERWELRALEELRSDERSEVIVDVDEVVPLLCKVAGVRKTCLYFISGRQPELDF